MHLLIDGKHFAYRAFYSMPELTREGDAFPIGAVHGFCRILWRLFDDYAGMPAEVFWDAGFKMRAELSPTYKAQRKPVPDALKAQLPYIERICNLMGLPSYKEQGSEADDLIATRACDLAEKGEEVLIVSADKDFAQCVNEKINLLQPPPTANAKESWKRIDAAGVREKFGVEPSQIADYLALMGDTSDNILGLEGVGPKTASEWLHLYKNIEGVLDNSGRLTPKSKQNLVYTSREKLLLNRQLTTLHRRELPATIRTEGSLDRVALIDVFKELHLRVCAEEAQKRYGASVR